jgi:integrase
MPKITNATVKAIQPGQLVWDSDVKGFGLRCQKSSKRFILATRAKGRTVWFAIGDAGTWTPTKARREAQRLLRELPVKDAEMLRRNPRGLMTVDSLADRYEKEHIDVHNRKSTAKGFKRLLKKHIRPALGKRAIVEVTSADAAKLHHSLRKTPRSANQALAVLSKMFSLAERWHLRPLNSNPAKGIQRFRETKRERFLSDAELVRLGQALAELQASGEIAPGIATAVRLLALTGCRLSEIRNLTWDDVDAASATLRIRDAKAGPRAHAIGATTLALLEILPRGSAYVAWVNPKAPISVSVMEKAWAKIRERAGLADARLHDLRHTFGTAAGQTGASAFLVRDALGHKTLAMTGRYVNKDADPLRQLADRVSNRIGAALAGNEAEIMGAETAPETKARAAGGRT